jgi:hypothetical protein
MPTHTAALPWLSSIRSRLTLAHITLGWFALSVIVVLASSTANERSDAARLVFWTVAVVSVIAGPMLSASALATDRHSGYIAFEQQRNGRSALRLAARYALVPQRFFVTAPLAAAPMMLWTLRAERSSQTWLVIAVALGAQVVATVSALAVAASLRRSEPPAGASIVSLFAMCGALGGSTAAVVYATDRAPSASPAYVLLCAALTLMLAAGVLRKLGDDEAPFFSLPLAIGAQLAVALSLITTSSGWSSMVDAQRTSVWSCVLSALLIAALARNNAIDGAQDVLRWKLDDARRPLDARDPRRTIVLSALLSAMCALPLISASPLQLRSLAALVFGVASLLIAASIAVARRTNSSALRWASFASVPVLLWTGFAMVSEPDSLAVRACPSLLASEDAITPETLALRGGFAALVVIAAIAWAQRSFARSVDELQVA